jgi:integrase
MKRRDPKTGAVRAVWMIDIVYEHPNGTEERVRKVSPIQTKRGAEQYERETREAIANGTRVFEQKEEPADDMPTLETFSKEFVETYSMANNKPSAVKAKQMILRVHLVPAFGTQRLDAIDVRKIEGYKSTKLKEGCQPKTVNTHLAVLGKLLRVAVEWNVLPFAPRVRLLREPKPPFDFLTFEEAEQLLARCEEEEPWKTMLLVAMRTGLRPGELRALRWQDVNLSSGLVTVRVNEVNGILGTPKDHDEREVGLCDDALAALKQLRHQRSERVFCHPDGRKLKVTECRAPLRRACKQAGLREITWYDLRHTFASHLTMRGVPLKVVQELMGHAAIEMTMRYAHLSPESKREAVRLLDRRVTAT